MVNIEINGVTIQARDGAMVIEAADEAGIVIPRFCYHKKLSVAANCRMCLVEVEKAAKPLPACATPVTEGMRIFTRSPKALDAQRGVMEFLLINHPLDCPICDQGGECDLQDIAMGFGEDISRYQEKKRVVKDKNIGPLISTDMTRCIHCTRCVRFGQEIAGVMELGATGRGEHMEIGTYIEKSVTSELSGNVIDLCPVGALTSKPFRYSARAWELVRHDGVAPHDCIGSNLHIETRGQRVMRVLPRENESINETWISDRDRFSYLGLYAEDRLQTPMVRVAGQWQETDWETALKRVVEGLEGVRKEHGADQLGALMSPCATTEEMYLLQRVMRALGSHNIDHRLRQSDFRAQGQMPAYPGLGVSIEDLESADTVLLVGSNIRKDQPIAAHRLRKAAVNQGARISVLNPVDYDFRFPLAHKLVVHPHQMVDALAGVAKALLDAGRAAPEGLAKHLDGVQADAAQRAVAEQLSEGAKAVVLLGNVAHAHPRYAELRMLADAVARMSGATFGQLTEGGNAAGAWLAGAVPHRVAGGAAAPKAGRDTAAMVADGLKGYVLMGIEPEYDCAAPRRTLETLLAAEFVVALSAYVTDTMRSYADVLLPIGAFAETSGTFVNAEGRWQSFGGAGAPLGDARPAWKVLRVLGNLLNLPGFEYLSSEEVRDELRAQVPTQLETPAWQWVEPAASSSAGASLMAEASIYAVDPLVRRAGALQQTEDAQSVRALVNEATAAKAHVSGAGSVVLRGGDYSVTLPLVIDARVPDDCVWVPTLPQGAGYIGVLDVEVSPGA
ncbi:NADH-quinone oxidoreductase subunit G [Ectothiorhodospiraceae bacterium 2226]|nr:NADH-quinone oxidoreductase subunit G [Ectothiorhodospiraceae bacterium 2226]